MKQLELLSQTVSSALPKDRFNLVFIIFLINGIGTLFPWNMLINADSYYSFKLNVTDPSPAVIGYRHNFLSYLGIASKVPNIFLQILNMAINAENANFSQRIIVTLAIQISIFLFIILCAALNSSTWPALFFWLTMASAAAINTANGIYQGCVYGLAARFPMHYINGVSIGMNISGTIASVLMILAIALSHDVQLEAIVFFSFAVALLAVCLGAEFFMTRNEFYKHYAKAPVAVESIKLQPTTASPVEPAEPTQPLGPLSRYLTILRHIWPQLLNILLIFTVSLSIFPAVAARIPSSDHTIDARYYTAVFCFLNFNLFATAGNFTAQWIQWPRPNWLVAVTLARIAFIPFFLYCNYQPSDDQTRSWPVLFGHDWQWILGLVLLAWSSGYTSSLAMMYIPKCVPASMSATAGMLGALTIILGILIGINSALLYPKMLLQ